MGENPLRLAWQKSKKQPLSAMHLRLAIVEAVRRVAEKRPAETLRVLYDNKFVFKIEGRYYSFSDYAALDDLGDPSSSSVIAVWKAYSGLLRLPLAWKFLEGCEAQGQHVCQKDKTPPVIRETFENLRNDNIIPNSCDEKCQERYRGVYPQLIRNACKDVKDALSDPNVSQWKYCIDIKSFYEAALTALQNRSSVELRVASPEAPISIANAWSVLDKWFNDRDSVTDEFCNRKKSLAFPEYIVLKCLLHSSP